MENIKEVEAKRGILENNRGGTQMHEKTKRGKQNEGARGKLPAFGSVAATTVREYTYCDGMLLQ